MYREKQSRVHWCVSYVCAHEIKPCFNLINNNRVITVIVYIHLMILYLTFIKIFLKFHYTYIVIKF